MVLLVSSTPLYLLLVTLCLLLLLPGASAKPFANHTNNWAVIVGTSTFWFNYRHLANPVSIYRSVKRLGIPDSQIILMLAEDVVCNPRNTYPGELFNNVNHHLNLYGEAIEVDYRGHDVNVESFVRVITGRHHPDTPRSKRLLTDDGKKKDMSGHGGNGFLKFQDSQELTSHELADAFAQMHEKKRYNQILFMADTCQATSLYEHFYSPDIVAIGSSQVGESAYSHHNDMDVGVSVIDKFTYYTLEFMEGIKQDSSASLADLFGKYPGYDVLKAHIGFKNGLNRNLNNVKVTEFFGSVIDVELTKSAYGEASR